jgi:T5SS/PEP-CTERM-associated repeat protein
MNMAVATLHCVSKTTTLEGDLVPFYVNHSWFSWRIKMKKTKRIVVFLGAALTVLPLSSTATTTWNGAVDSDWNTAGNWSDLVPGDPGNVDNNARIEGGTVSLTAAPAFAMGAVDFRINTGGNVNTVTWNPGAADVTSIDVMIVGANNNGSVAFNHDSGRINLGTTSTDQFRVGGTGNVSYTMGGTATVGVNEAFMVGGSGNGTTLGHLIMNGNSQLLDTVNDNGEARVGVNSGAAGQISMNDNSFIDTRGNFRLGDASGSVGTILMTGSSAFDNRNELRVGFSGEGHLVMQDNTVLRFGVGSQNDLSVGSEVGSSGTVTLSGSAALRGAGNNQDDISIGDLGSGVLIMNDSSSINTSVRDLYVADNAAASTGVVTLNGSSSIAARSNVQVGRNGAGTLTLNDNASLNAGNLLRMAAGNAASSFVTVNGAGASVSVLNNLEVASANGNGGTALFDQNAGTVFVQNSLTIGTGNVGAGNAGTYNLDGGTLHVNNIAVDSATGVFNWGAGTLTVRQVQQNASGDGSIINYAGDLTTGVGSTLLLNDLYESSGIRFDKLAVSGVLDLSSGTDIFDFWGDVQRLRGRGGVTTGELQLISATSILGEFDTILGPGPDAGTFFRTWGPGEIAQGTSAEALQLNHGYLDYRAGDGVYFVYKVNGQVPEPQTGMLVIFAVLFLRGLSKRSWLVMLRHKLNG